MAIISKIRSKSTILLLSIGIAMLLFLLGDLFSSGNRGIFGPDTEVGQINGKTISYKEFEMMVQEKAELYKSNTGQLSVDQNTLENIRQQTWSELVNEFVLVREVADIGVVVTPEELYDMVQGPNPHSAVRQNFTNPETGVFNPQDVVRYIQNLDRDETGEAKIRWSLFEKSLKKERQASKYYNLIKKGLMVTTKEAEADFISKNQKVTIKFVAKKYDSVSDSSVTYTDKDLKAYYDEHKSEPQYQQKETMRAIEYVTFDLIPSEADRQSLLETMNSIKQEFATTISDTLFSKSNSESKTPVQYYTEGSFPSEIDSAIFKAEKGALFGPYEEDGMIKVAKVLDFRFVPDSVDARHILIKINNGDTAKALAKADSLKKIIKAKKNFAELAKEVSEDFGSAQDGGNLNWFTEGKMVKPFNDACFEGKAGDMPIVTSDFGIHLIEILKQTQPKKKVLVALADKRIIPGKKTIEEGYNAASKFSITNNTPELFKKAGNELGIKIADFIREADKNIQGIDNSREIVRWAYQAEKGDVSEPFEAGEKFVVCHLTQIKEKGTLKLEAVKEQVIAEVIKEKKAEKFISELNGNSLDEIASKNNLSVESATDINMNASSIPGIGAERNLIGTIFGSANGVLSKPVKGKQGVYVFVVENIAEAPSADYSASKEQLARNYAGRVEYEVFEALKEVKSVEDNRGKFY
jgi:peptidyl-prolyl cis-trans isomerase D